MRLRIGPLFANRLASRRFGPWNWHTASLVCRYRPKTTTIHPHPQDFAGDLFPRNTRENDGVFTEPAIRLRSERPQVQILPGALRKGLLIDRNLGLTPFDIVISASAWPT
jgi:hypothetical protein